MKTEFETIALSTLVLVNGGQDAEQGSGNIGITVPTGSGEVQVGVQGEFSRSNYAKCVDTVSAMPNATPADLAYCGLPPSGGQ